MQSDSTTTAMPVEPQATDHLTEGAVKSKIKHMVVDRLNTGMRNMTYTTRMIMPTHTFEQLNLTEHDKTRLILQCDEWFKIDLDSSALGIVRVADLIDKVTAALSAQDRLDIEQQPEGQTDQAGV